MVVAVVVVVVCAGREREEETNYAKNVQLVYIHTRRGCRYNSPLTPAAAASCARRV